MRQKLGELEFSPWQFCLGREGSFLLSWFQPQLSGFLGCYKLRSTCSDLFLSCTSPLQRSDRVSALSSSQELFKKPSVPQPCSWCWWSCCVMFSQLEQGARVGRNRISAFCSFPGCPMKHTPQGKGATGHWRIPTGDSLSVCLKRKT